MVSNHGPLSLVVLEKFFFQRMSNFLFSSFIFWTSDVSGSSDEETRIALWARWQIKHQEFMAWIPWLLQDFVWWGSWAGWPHQHAGDELLVGSLRIVVTPLSVVCAHHGTLTVLQRPHTQRSAHIWYASCHRQWFQGANLGGLFSTHGDAHVGGNLRRGLDEKCVISETSLPPHRESSPPPHGRPNVHIRPINADCNLCI